MYNFQLETDHYVLQPLVQRGRTSSQKARQRKELFKCCSTALRPLTGQSALV